MGAASSSSNKSLGFSFDSNPSSITPGASTSSSSFFDDPLFDNSDFSFYANSDPSNSFITPGASTSNLSIPKRFKYDVFISFRGEDTRKSFVDHLYHALKDKGIYTYKDDEKIQKGKRISDDLIKSIEDSKFYIIVFSKNYASSSWCLDELVKIMECHKMTDHTAYPVFYDVEPTEVRKQSGAVGKGFAKYEKEVRKKRRAFGLAFFMKKKKAMLKKRKGALKEAANLDKRFLLQHKAKKWKGVLKEAADLAGSELKNTLDGHEAKFIKKIVQTISLELRSINFGFDEKLVGMETRVKDVVSSLEPGTDEVRMIGIKGMGGVGKTTTARAVFDYLSADFDAKIFVENVREVSKASMFGLKNLQEQVLSKVLNEPVTLDSVSDGKNMMKERMYGRKVLLVLDDVDHINQLEALAGEPKWFKPGSRIIVTTRDEQVLVAHRVNLIRDINLLSDKEAICLFCRYAFGRDVPSQGYGELSGKVVRYAAGLPLTVKVLGSSLCGKDKLEWVDAIDRLEKIPLKDTLEKLELSYITLEDDCKEIFLDVACIMKGWSREKAIRILESCGFHARNGLKVLEQRSLITIEQECTDLISSKYHQVLGMHDHIEEMGKNIVRRSREPNEHSRLWIDEEIEAILANDMGTEATRCLKLTKSRGNARIVMKGLGKMKKLRYLEVNFAYYDSDETDSESDDCDFAARCLKFTSNKSRCLNDTRQYFSNSLRYLKCSDYPFLYLPKTFEANNLVELQIRDSKMVQLWKERKKKELRQLKFLNLYESNLTTFDFRITPNLETLSLENSYKLVELCMPVSCQKLKHLNISRSKLRTFDLGLTPNLERLHLFDCADFVELYVSAACPNLKILNLSNSRLRSLDLELIPNLERLHLAYCDELVKINAPVGCLKKVFYFDLSRCRRFHKLVLDGGCDPSQVNRSSATLDLVGESLDLCPLHPNSNLPKLQFGCYYEENLPSSVGNIEKLISFGLCACTDLKKFSDIICSLRCLRKLTLKCDIPEFPKDLGLLESLEELCVYSAKIKHLPDSICMLKRLKSLTFNTGYIFTKLHEDLLEKLPEDLGKLECLEKLHVSSKKIEYLPDSICMLKRLKCLDVTECCCLGKLPEDIGQLESLERLVLMATRIKHLPDNICMLKHLKYLNLRRCALPEKLPEDLGRLECLEHLDITYTGISHLPQSIFGLKGLHIAAPPELLQLYDFPLEITTTTYPIWCRSKT